MSELPNSSTQDGPPWRWTLAALALLAIAAFLRFDAIAEPSLWLDEILHYKLTLDTVDAPWHAWLTGVSDDRENGSLFYASQRFGLWLADGELGVRLMPALAGLAAVAVLFLVGFAATGSGLAATVGMAVLALAPLHVYYSREGRPYAAVMLAAALILWLALESRSADGQARTRGWLVGAFYLVALGTAYLGAVGAPVLASVVALAGLEWLRDRRGFHLLAASVAGLVVVALMVPAAERLGTAIGKGKPAATTLEITGALSPEALDRLLASFTVSGVDRGTTTVVSFLLLALATWGGVTLARRDARRALWVVGMCVLPLAGWLALLVALDHWYNVRYTSAGLPAFAVLVGCGLVDLCERLGQAAGRVGRRPIWVVGVLVWGCLCGLLLPAWNASRVEPFQKPDWRGVAQLISGLAAPREPVITRGGWSQTCIRHYLREAGSEIEVLSANHDLVRAKRLAREHRRAWVLGAGYRRSAELQAWMRTLDPVLQSGLAKIELYFLPGFKAFLNAPGRLDGLTALLERRGEPGARQEMAGSDLLLGAGWSYPERGPDGSTFRWALGERAELALLAPAEAGPRTLTLRLMPFPSPDRGPQSVEVVVNSRFLAQVDLKQRWTEVKLPAYEGHPTADRLSFEFAWSQAPRELDAASPDTRRLAVAFDFVDVGVD